MRRVLEGVQAKRGVLPLVWSRDNGGAYREGELGEWLDANLPQFITQGMNVTFFFGGTSLLIVVGVAMDTVQQVESQLIMRHYDGFMKKSRIRGRRGA